MVSLVQSMAVMAVSSGSRLRFTIPIRPGWVAELIGREWGARNDPDPTQAAGRVSSGDAGLTRLRRRTTNSIRRPTPSAIHQHRVKSTRSRAKSTGVETTRYGSFSPRKYTPDAGVHVDLMN